MVDVDVFFVKGFWMIAATPTLSAFQRSIKRLIWKTVLEKGFLKAVLEKCFLRMVLRKSFLSSVFRNSFWG